MEELDKIRERNNDPDIFAKIEKSNIQELNGYALKAFEDTAELYDIITRIKNTERNTSGYSLNDAAIIGLLVKVWKLLKSSIEFHKSSNADHLSLLDRPMLEAAVTATFLLNKGDTAIEDYRKCSYKNRLRILEDAKAGNDFFQTEAGKKLINSINHKLLNEGYTENSFQQQKQNKWKIQGKNFYEIFSEVWEKEVYRYTFGMQSENIHASWGHSLEFDLTLNQDNTYNIHPFFIEPDIRYIASMLVFTSKPYELWLNKIEVIEEDVNIVLDFMSAMNTSIFLRFNELYKPTLDNNANQQTVLPP